MTESDKGSLIDRAVQTRNLVIGSNKVLTPRVYTYQYERADVAKHHVQYHADIASNVNVPFFSVC